VAAKKDAEIEVMRSATQATIRGLNEKLLAAETRAEEAEKRTSEVQDTAGITQVMIARDEKIMALYGENIRLLDKKSRFGKEILDKMNELFEKSAELESKKEENVRLKKALASMLG
jgi:hypothetical protein